MVGSASYSNQVTSAGEGKSKLDNDGEGNDELDGGSASESSLDDPADESWGSNKKSSTPRKQQKPTRQRSKRSKIGKDGFNESNNGSNVAPCIPAFTSIAVKPANRGVGNPYGPS